MTLLRVAEAALGVVVHSADSSPDALEPCFSDHRSPRVRGDGAFHHHSVTKTNEPTVLFNHGAAVVASSLQASPQCVL